MNVFLSKLICFLENKRIRGSMFFRVAEKFLFFFFNQNRSHIISRKNTVRPNTTKHPSCYCRTIRFGFAVNETRSIHHTLYTRRYIILFDRTNKRSNAPPRYVLYNIIYYAFCIFYAISVRKFVFYFFFFSYFVLFFARIFRAYSTTLYNA